MATVATSRASSSAGTRGRWFYVGFAVLAAAVVFEGFERTYYLKNIFGTPSLPLLLHIHGIVFTLWLVLFAAQVLLVNVRRTDVHRRLGAAGGVLAAVMTVVIVVTSIEITKPGFRAGPPAPLGFLSVPLFNILAFAGLAAAGFWFRKTPETHKRLMTLATISILPAAIARFPVAFIQTNGSLAFFGLADVMWLGCVVYDAISRRKLYPAYLWGGAFLVTTQFACVYVGKMAWFQSFAQWMTRLV